MLQFEDLHDVVLIGHSYGGMVATGVADRAPERLAQLVYLDAFVPHDGQCLFDLLSSETNARMREAARTEGDGAPFSIGPCPAPLNTAQEATPECLLKQGRLFVKQLWTLPVLSPGIQREETTLF